MPCLAAKSAGESDWEREGGGGGGGGSDADEKMRFDVMKCHQ